MVALRHRFLMFVALAAVLYGAPAYSQTGSVTGTVRDATGAGIPGVTVTVTNQATNASKTTTTANDGTFSVGELTAGTYSVSAYLVGFRRVTHKDVAVADAAVPSEFALEAVLAEEITVTAMKRESTIQNIPLSVAAPTEETLHARGVEDIEGVARNVAGFSVQNLGPGQSQVAMRGVSSGQIARDQPGVKEQVGAYLDESVISLSLFTPDMDLFDMNRVEVLRGPQGTLFGSGSESGTVRYISNQPELGAKEVFGEVGGSSVDGGSQGGNVKLGFNAPLGDKAAVRVAGFFNKLPGWIDTPSSTRGNGIVRPDPQARKEDVNTGTRTGVRAAIKFAPNDKFSITPRLVYQKVEADGWNRQDIFNILANPFTTSRPAVTLGEREQYVQIEEPFDDEFVLGDLTWNYNFGNVSLTSITSYTHRDILVVRDATALTASITGGSIGLAEPVYTIDAPLDDATVAKVWTQEARLSGNKEKFHWVLGGFYAKTTRDYGQSLLVSGFESLTGIPTAGRFGAGRDVLFFSDLHYELKQFAAFGEATIDVSDQFAVTGGLRFYDFDEERTQAFDGIFADPASKPGEVSANGIAPRLILSYKASKNTNVNAQVSKGFRLGGINDQLNVPLCTAQDLATYSGLDFWDDEKAWSYEVGSKSRIAGGRGSFNVSAFYTDIRDLQATETAGSCSSRVVLNVPKARSTGAEVELAMTPNNNFDFAISGSYADAKLKSTFSSAGGDLGIHEGSRLPSVPKFQMAAAATYQWSVMTNSLAYITGTFQHVGSRFTQVGDELSCSASGVCAPLGPLSLNSFGNGTIGKPLTQSTFVYDAELPSYSIVNARVGVKREKWDASLFVNNVTDENALLALDRERGTRARIGFLVNQPRTFGVSLRFNF